MAGKQILKEDLERAVAAYCQATGKTFSDSEGGKIRIMKDTPESGDPIVWLDAGCLQSSPVEFGLDFMEYLKPSVMPVNGRSPGRGVIMHTNGQKSSLGQMKPVSGAVRDIQVAEMTFEDIRNFLCPAASDKDTFMFLKLCQARNLNPFCNEAYLIPYEDKKTGEIKCSMVVGKEAFMRKAEANPAYRGFKAGIIISKGEELIYREGTLCRKGETLEGGWCEVYRSDRDQPIRSEVSLIEYDKGFGLWAQGKKATMIRKTAVVGGHREAFPSDTSGMYGAEEMGIDPEREVPA